jgi:DNA-binding MarR family transcriptional regulator
MRDRTKSVKGNIELEVAAGLDNVLFGVWLVSRATTELLNDVLRPSGLDADEFALYSVLVSADAVTPSELAKWMAAPPTTVSSYVKRLEARGHIERVPNPADRRSFRLRLTAAGRKAHRDAGARFLPVRESVRAALGRDEATVLGSLRSLRRAVDTVRLL